MVKSQDARELFVNYYPNHSKILIFDYFFAINGSLTGYLIQVELKMRKEAGLSMIKNLLSQKVN